MSDSKESSASTGGWTSTPIAAHASITSSQPTHNHTIDSEKRGVVVGKCLTKASGPNKVIQVLVDIAG